MSKSYIPLLATILLSSTILAAYAGNVNWTYPDDVWVSNDSNSYNRKEAHVVKSPASSTNLLALYIDYQQNKCRAASSSDGGNSWIVRSYLPLPSGTTVSVDPVLSASGNTWYAVCFALTDSSYSIGDISVIYYAISTDNGASWSSPTAVKTESCVSSTNCPLVDKPWIAVSGSNVYVCWARYDNYQNLVNGLSTGVHIKFIRIGGSELNLADGTAYPRTSSRVNSDRSVQGCNIAINNNGVVYVAWSKLTSNTAGSMQLKRSFNSGALFDATKTIRTFTRTPTVVGNCIDAYGCVQGLYINGNTGFRVPNFPYMAIDSSNNLHVVYMDYSSTSLTDIKYTKSTNCATSGSSCTFTTGVKVLNDGSVAKDQFLPSIIVSTSNTLHITALDRRDSLQNTEWYPKEYHCHLSTNACTVETQWEISSISSYSSINFDGNVNIFIGDYYSVTSNSATEAIPLWVDTRSLGQQKYQIWSDITT